MTVALRGGSHDHLGGLPRRGEAGGVAAGRQLLFGPGDVPADLPHGPQDCLPLLVRGKKGQTGGAGQLDVHREPVGQQAKPPGEGRVRPGDGLGVDVATEAVLLPEQTQRLDHLLGGVVRAAQHRGGEEQSLNIVAPVESHGQLAQLPGSEGRPGEVVGPAVDAVLAVVGADIGHQHLQQGDAPAVGGEGVAAARHGGAAHRPRPAGAVQAAGGAGGVVLRGVRQNFQLVQQFHQVPLPT